MTISRQRALEALDSLDDFARMAGVVATGPIEALTDFINAADISAKVEPFVWFWQDGSDSGVLTNPNDVFEHRLTYPRMTFTPLYTAPHPAEAPVGWISVTNRLPEDCDPRLVYLVRRATGEGMIAQSSLNPVKTGFYVEYDEDDSYPLEDVTHWMPLPAAPRSDK